QDVEDAGVQKRCRPELPDPAVLKDRRGRGLEPVLEQRRIATKCVLEQEHRAVDHDQSLAPGCHPGKPARTTRFTTIIFAVIDSHGGSAPAGGTPNWPVHSRFARSQMTACDRSRPSVESRRTDAT